MATVQEIQYVRHLLQRIERILKTKDRHTIASVYETVLAVESYFPRPPLSITRNKASNLRKEVCSYCPSKVKPKKMEEYVAQAKRDLRTYAQKLREWIAEKDEPIPPQPWNVHNLDSTI